MTAQNLEALGFTRVDVTAEESGYERDWYYFTYDFGNGALSLISSDDSESADDSWHVEVFEDQSIRFTDMRELSSFIELVERNTIVTQDDKED